MDIKQYRQQVESELRASEPGAPPAGETVEAAAARATAPGAQAAGDRTSDPEIRARAMTDVAVSESNAAQVLPLLLSVLRDATEAPVVRLAALRGLKAASFLPPLFSAWRPQFLQTLREIATDADPSVRESALEVLSMHKDGYVQGLLMDGLRHPERALVAAAKAVQLLSHDPHADHFPMLRQFAQQGVDLDTRIESLRALAADPGSHDLLARLFQDRNEFRQVRALSAAGLQFLDPNRFVEVAKSIVADPDEYDDIRTTSMNALSRFDDYREALRDSGFVDRVRALRDNVKSETLRSSAQRFLRRHDEDR